MIDNLMVDKPTNASYTSESFAMRKRSSGWFEITVPITGTPVATVAIKGGNSKDQTTHDGIEFTAANCFVNGANLSDTPVTGLTISAAGTLSIANTLAAAVRIRIPVINVPPWISGVYTRSSGGSATAYIQMTFDGRESS